MHGTQKTNLNYMTGNKKGKKKLHPDVHVKKTST